MYLDIYNFLQLLPAGSSGPAQHGRLEAGEWLCDRVGVGAWRAAQGHVDVCAAAGAHRSLHVDLQG